MAMEIVDVILNIIITVHLAYLLISPPVIVVAECQIAMYHKLCYGYLEISSVPSSSSGGGGGSGSSSSSSSISFNICY